MGLGVWYSSEVLLSLVVYSICRRLLLLSLLLLLLGFWTEIVWFG